MDNFSFSLRRKPKSKSSAAKDGYKGSPDSISPRLFGGDGDANDIRPITDSPQKAARMAKALTPGPLQFHPHARTNLSPKVHHSSGAVSVVQHTSARIDMVDGISTLLQSRFLPGVSPTPSLCSTVASIAVDSSVNPVIEEYERRLAAKGKELRSSQEQVARLEEECADVRELSARKDKEVASTLESLWEQLSQLELSVKASQQERERLQKRVRVQQALIERLRKADVAPSPMKH